LHGALSKCISAEKQQHLAGVIVINKELSFAFIQNKKGPNKRGENEERARKSSIYHEFLNFCLPLSWRAHTEFIINSCIKFSSILYFWFFSPVFAAQINKLYVRVSVNEMHDIEECALTQICKCSIFGLQASSISGYYCRFISCNRQRPVESEENWFSHKSQQQTNPSASYICVPIYICISVSRDSRQLQLQRLDKMAVPKKRRNIHKHHH